MNDEDAKFEFDIVNEHEFLSVLKGHNFEISRVQDRGVGGGWPVYHVYGNPQAVFHVLKDVIDIVNIDELVNVYKVQD